VHIAQCKIYLKVEHNDKILAAKWNSLQKHVGQKNDDIPMKGVKKGEWYTNNEYKQNRNQASYVSKGRKFVLKQVTNGLVGEKCRKLVQFATLFHTLKHGRPMLEYEVHKDLFDFLNLEENPKMHLDRQLRLGYGLTYAWHYLGGDKICCWSSPIVVTYL
jgi:hypothetical protein